MRSSFAADSAGPDGPADTVSSPEFLEPGGVSGVPDEFVEVADDLAIYGAIRGFMDVDDIGEGDRSVETTAGRFSDTRSWVGQHRVR